MPTTREARVRSESGRETIRPERNRQGEGIEVAALFPEIIGECPRLRRVLESVASFAASDLPVLIQGESGTGKELIAQAIHRLGPQATGPFVSENCGALPEQLVEAELFGHARGAFTGSVGAKAGLVERADGGTLFLDEVGEMDTALQKKLLRVLETRHVRRVGATRQHAVDFRLVSATNRDLEAMVRRRTFRQDLFYRLHVGAVELPPLRSRGADILHIARHFNETWAAQAGRRPLTLTRRAEEWLLRYEWPGNVRELANEMRRLQSVVREVVGVNDLSPRITSRERCPLETSTVDHPTLTEIERQLMGGALRRTLDLAKGNRTEAARLLGVTRSTLYRRLERYGLQ